MVFVLYIIGILFDLLQMFIESLPQKVLSTVWVYFTFFSYSLTPNLIHYDLLRKWTL